MGTALVPADIRIRNNNAQRTPCALVLDASGSMTGEPIRELNAGLRALAADLKEDVAARHRVELLVVRVGGAPSVVFEWQDAAEFVPPTLEADGATPLGEGMRLALRRIEEEKAELKRHGVGYTRPWLFMISDGLPTDTGWESAAGECVRACEDARVVIFPIGVRDADLWVLGRFSTTSPKRLDGLQFQKLFRWLSRSASAASRVAPGRTAQMADDDWSAPPT